MSTTLLSQPLILASRSDRRKRLLEQSQIPYLLYPADIEETILPEWTPEEAAVALAKQKAQAIKHKVEQIKISDYSCILAADTIVVVNDKILGKPDDEQHAYEMIWELTRNRHSVITGVCLWPRGWQQPLQGAETTLITMKPVGSEDIQAYIATGQAMGKAGAFDVEEVGAQYVETMQGNFDNVVGLPMALVNNLIQKWMDKNNEHNRL